MDIAELKQQAGSQGFDEDDDILIEEVDSDEALDLLQRARQMLSFFGDPTLGRLNRYDRQRMLALAESINTYLAEVL